MCVLPRERGARGRGLCSPVDDGGGKVSLSVGVIDEGGRPACDGRLKTAHILFTHRLIRIPNLSAAIEELAWRVGHDVSAMRHVRGSYERSEMEAGSVASSTSAIERREQHVRGSEFWGTA